MRLKNNWYYTLKFKVSQIQKIKKIWVIKRNTNEL